jgi:hypothetical protein
LATTSKGDIEMFDLFDLDDECVIIGLCALGFIVLLVMYQYLEQAISWLVGMN